MIDSDMFSGSEEKYLTVAVCFLLAAALVVLAAVLA